MLKVIALIFIVVVILVVVPIRFVVQSLLCVAGFERLHIPFLPTGITLPFNGTSQPQ